VLLCSPKELFIGLFIVFPALVKYIPQRFRPLVCVRGGEDVGLLAERASDLELVALGLLDLQLDE
jgi:hypothetical protein